MPPPVAATLLSEFIVQQGRGAHVGEAAATANPGIAGEVGIGGRQGRARLVGQRRRRMWPYCRSSRR